MDNLFIHNSFIGNFFFIVSKIVLVINEMRVYVCRNMSYRQTWMGTK